MSTKNTSLSKDHLIEVFNKIAGDYNESHPGLAPDTRAIMNSLTRFAYEKNLWVACKPTDEDSTTTEWMWDFVVYESSEKGEDVGKLLLVLESENSTYLNEIKVDLQKILVARAEIRCYVFPAGDLNHREKVFNKILKIIRTNPNVQPDDEFLIAGWSSETRQYDFRNFKGRGI